MNRRQFLSTATAAGLACAASAVETGKHFRVAVIGHTGRGNYGHGLDTMWLAVPETEIVGVADADPKGLEAARKKLNGVRGFADYHAMLAELKPDIAAIAPRFVDEHRDMALAAIESGVRGIYMEKPFCRTPAEADEIVAACAKAGVKLAEAHRNRWHPALPVAKRAVEDGTLGQLLEIRARGKEDTRGGAQDLWVLGVHLFNLMHYFAGKPTACSAVMLKGHAPVTADGVVEGAEGLGPIAGDRVHARFEMESGVVAYFDSIKSAGVAAANFGVQLVGTKGLIDFRIDVEPLAHFVPGNPCQPGTEARPWVPISSAGIGRPEPIADLKAQVAGHVLGARDLLGAIRENRPALCSAEDARVTVEMVHAVFASHVAGGARVALPLAERSHALAKWKA
jgi:predicted dehydrogenase